MKTKHAVNTIFTDIGGVLLTNGWDRGCRRRAIDFFKLDPEETEERHHLTFDTYEVGKITLDEYLDRVVFYKKQSFTRKKFHQFMYDQSKPFPEMIALLQQIKNKYGIKIAVVSNEGRELAEYRIRQYKLYDFADFFIVSSFVHFRKPLRPPVPIWPRRWAAYLACSSSSLSLSRRERSTAMARALFLSCDRSS